MTGPDLIRLATELARCGGMHRLTNLIVAANHVFLEHERAAAVDREMLDDELVGVGMSDKVALAGTPDGPAIIERYKADRDAASRAPEREEASGRPDDASEGRWALVGSVGASTARAVKCACGASRDPHDCDTANFRNPAPLTSINGERKPLPAMESDHG